MPAGQRLGERGDVGLNAVMLVRAPLAGAAHAGLNLVDDEQRAGGAGQCARFGEELLRQRPHAALALNGLDENGADFARKFRAQIGNVVEAHELNARNHGRERLAVLFLVRGGHGAEGAAVEALLQRQKLRPDVARPRCACRPAYARASFSAPSHASVPVVGKEDAVQAGALGEPHGQLRLALVIVEVRGVDQRAALRARSSPRLPDGYIRAR